MVEKGIKVTLWLAFLFIWPISILLIALHWPTLLEGQWIDVLAFGVLMAIVAFFPLIVNNTPIFFVHGISFAVFLYFGLLVEVILTQIAVLFLLAKIRMSKDEHFRIPLNLLMFLLVSVISASVFTLLGGEIGKSSMKNLLPVFGYIISVFVSNQLLLYGFRKVIYRENIKLIDRGLAWEFFTTLLMVPVGFALYALYTTIGVSAIFFIGLPFVCLSFIFTLYYSSHQINYYLQQTSEIGQELISEYEVNDVIDLFMERIIKLLPIDYAFIYRTVDDSYLQLIRFCDTEKKLDFPAQDKLAKFESISGTAWGNNERIYYQSKNKWTDLKPSLVPIDCESVVSIPFERQGKVIGVVTILSRKKRAFEKYQFMILRILVNYFAVAIENARKYEETRSKSERDALTKLYNYRYLEEYLDNYVASVNSIHPVSLILLDLDHFKLINDEYGHQSGNEILKMLASRLIEVIGDRGIVARYGGEEFVILLPNIDQNYGHFIAESLRAKIAEEYFLIANHILKKGSPVKIQVTASIGIATYPMDCEDPRDLIRHADRAMYVGAKQKGRNKVALYERL